MSTTAEQHKLQKEWFEHKLAAVKPKKEVVDHVRAGDGDFVLLDARDRASFEKEHIAGALPMPLAEVDALAAELDCEREHVVYCWHAT